MRKVAILTLVLLVLATTSAIAGDKGGCMPAALGCFLGPRIGLEYNEGKPVETTEWLRLVGIGVLINDYEAFQKNGPVGCLLENFVGPRVGRQYDYRNVRILEWIGIVTSPIPQVIMAFEAYQGKTMTEIEQQENLRKQ
ncbi:MAG: hypothetical protein Q7J55_05200 [bacterium]|nr:hypothetical protein [bacterium]